MSVSRIEKTLQEMAAGYRANVSQGADPKVPVANLLPLFEAAVRPPAHIKVTALLRDNLTRTIDLVLTGRDGEEFVIPNDDEGMLVSQLTLLGCHPTIEVMRLLFKWTP